MTKSKEVAKAKNTDVAISSFEEDAGGGFESADIDAFAVPFINILQKNSPQADMDDPGYMKGAEAGMLFNTATQEFFKARSEDDDEGLLVIPCDYKRSYIEWKPRDEGGGFIAEHDVAAGQTMLATCRNVEGKMILPNGNILSDTRVHYVCMIVDGTIHPAVISMASSQIKKSKRWMSVMDNLKMDGAHGKFTPPMFSSLFKLTTGPESNEKGNWRGWIIERVGTVEADNYYQAAKAFRDQISAKEVIVNHDQGASTGNNEEPIDVGVEDM